MQSQLPFDEIIEREGDFVNNPADHGGPTRWGITLDTLSEFRGRRCTVSDVQNLSKDEAWRIYEQMFMVEPGFDKIADAFVLDLVVDTGVLHNPDRAARFMQSIIPGLKVDGNFGPKTAAAVNAVENPKVLAIKYAIVRARYEAARVQENANRRRQGQKLKDQALFIDGWIHRATEFVLEAIA